VRVEEKKKEKKKKEKKKDRHPAALPFVSSS
jgi:hypothetical protein